MKIKNKLTHNLRPVFGTKKLIQKTGLVRENYKAFTLVELIVVITILAILGTIAFISLQGFSRDARDSVRITDMKSIQKGLELFRIKGNSYLMPEDYLTVTASGTTIRYQGIAGPKVLGSASVHGGGQDPLTNEYYDYILDGTKNQIQISGYFENSTLVNNSLTNQSYAVEKGNFIKTIGAYLGLITKNNEGLHKTNTGILDIRNTSEEYTVVFSEGDSITSSSGQVLFTNIYNRDKGLLNSKELAKLDDSLVLYFDMETTTMSGSLQILKDLSQYENNGELKGGIQIGDEVGKYGKATYFDGIDDFIIVNKDNFLSLPTNDFTILSYLKTRDNLVQRCIISTSINGGTGFRFGYGGGYPYYLHGGHIEGYITSGEKLNNNIYSYLVMKFELGNLITGYSNGNYYGEFDLSSYNFGDKAALNKSQLMYIGRMNGGPNNYIKGSIDEIRVYNRGLSENEIRTVYGSTLD